MSSSEPASLVERRYPRLHALEIVAFLLLALGVLVASHVRLLPLGRAEAWGFATGLGCVWLVVREHPWNWPIGLANNLLFLGLFLEARLYADMGLQVVYFGLGVWGFYHWIFGGKAGEPLRVSRSPRSEWWAALVLLPLGTLGLRALLVEVGGASPFWDALSTVASLWAQYLLSLKRLENWLFWLAADLVYVPLYWSRGLPLTAVLYAVFLLLCCVGGLRWWRSVGQVQA